MKCFYCKKDAVGMKATDYYNTAATCFRFLCKEHWDMIETLYYNEKENGGRIKNEK